MINAYELARKRIIRKKRFYQHLAVAMGTLIFLFLINFLHFFNWIDFHPGMGKSELLRAVLRFPYWWFPYPTLGWGLFLFIHYCFAFGIPFIGQFDEKWEAEAIEAEMKRIQHQAHVRNSRSTENPMQLKTLQKETLQKEDIENSEFL